ncbi:MAG: TonB-dependent receptor, partial [Saprospiraceae bacterium]
IRGNSPKGILWKLEGIEIPNPNHFGSTGGGGGNISMLSSSTLDKSDFYTGAFPAEFGNALSGVFDLKLRRGNNDKHEHSVMIGALGIEAATEGPLKINSSSYLVNFRYSTFALLKGVAEIEGVTPDYQDISFKVFLPTKKAGSFSVFGLGGINKSLRKPQEIDFVFEAFGPLYRVEEKGSVGVVGLSHQIFLTKKSYLQTILAATSDNYSNKTDTLDPHNKYLRGAVGRTKFLNTTYKLSSSYNNKINSHHTIQFGIILSKLGYNFNDQQYNPSTKNWNTNFNSNGNSIFYEGYVQWKWRLNNRIDIVPGIHYSALALDKTKSIEPRISISYNASNNQKIILAVGQHSRPEHLSTYFFHNSKNTQQDKFQDLKFAKASHIVFAYHKIYNGYLFKAETYYQYLFDIAVEKNASSFFSTINALSVYDLYNLDSSLISSGRGSNYGVDITVEKPFIKNWHFLVTGSLFKSRYSTYNGKFFPAKLDRGYQCTAIAGKEWSINKNERKRIAINGKLLTAGGLRESPVDQVQSDLQKKLVYVKDQYYSKQTPSYFRMDIGISYKINRPESTHTIMLDVQNIFNYRNISGITYNIQSKQSSNEYGLGLFPLFNYRVEF